ncbi:MAG TPA: MaoC family dehydratase [Pseudonocardiaceae bacterium]
MATFDSIDALTAAVGQTLGTTEWQVVSQERIRAFADVTGDHQWIHVDEERAQVESPFGTTVAHGALTLALVPVFVGELVRVPGASMVVNGGLERVRFRAPVPAGAKVRGMVKLLSTVELADATQVVARATVQVYGEQKPACVADQVMVLHD